MYLVIELGQQGYLSKGGEETLYADQSAFDRLVGLCKKWLRNGQSEVIADQIDKRLSCLSHSEWVELSKIFGNRLPIKYTVFGRQLDRDHQSKATTTIKEER